MDLVIAQLTIGASTWLDCQWGRIFASANEDSLRKLIDVATLAPAENSWARKGLPHRFVRFSNVCDLCYRMTSLRLSQDMRTTPLEV
jgi:hypothetical protein